LFAAFLMLVGVVLAASASAFRSPSFSTTPAIERPPVGSCQLAALKVGSGFDLTRALKELEALRYMLNDDKVAREVVAPALLLIQAERLGVNEATLRYFGAVASGAIDGDGYVSAAMGEVGLTSGERAIAQLWGGRLSGIRH
jgi:hypothetical protein